MLTIKSYFVRLSKLRQVRTFLFSCFLITTSLISFSQSTYKLKADSVKISNDAANTELILENSTKNVNGFLYNKGNGRTEFRKAVVKLNDSTYLVGGDTLKTGASSSLSYVFNQTIQQTNANFNIDGTGSLGKLNVYGNNDLPIVNLKLAANASPITPVVTLKDNFDSTLLEIRSYYRTSVNSSSLYIGTGSGASVSFASSLAGGFNTALGHLALASNTTGAFNSAMGHLSLAGLQTGSFNTAFGDQSLPSMITGEDNTAVGQATMLNKTSGNYNVALGSNSLQENLTGSNNTALGRAAGRYNNGSYNVFVGKSAGQSNTGSGNVFIGYYAGSVSGNISNKLYIHNNTSNTPLIYGDFDSMDVKINGHFYVGSLSPTTGSSDSLLVADINGQLKKYKPASIIGIPKLNTSQRDSLSSTDSQNGFMLYNTDSSKFQYYNGSNWSSLLSTASQVESAIVVVKTFTVSNATSFDIDLSNYYTIYDRIDLEFSNVRPATDNVTMQLYVSSDGTNFDNGSNNYKYSSNFSISNGAYGPHVSQGDTRINLGDYVSNSISSYFSGTITLTDADNSSVNPFVRIQVGYTNSNGDIITNVGWGKRLASQVTKKVRIKPTSGNISGTVKIIGYK